MTPRVFEVIRHERDNLLARPSAHPQADLPSKAGRGYVFDVSGGGPVRGNFLVVANVRDTEEEEAWRLMAALPEGTPAQLLPYAGGVHRNGLLAVVRDATQGLANSISFGTPFLGGEAFLPILAADTTDPRRMLAAPTVSHENIAAVRVGEVVSGKLIAAPDKRTLFIVGSFRSRSAASTDYRRWEAALAGGLEINRSGAHKLSQLTTSDGRWLAALNDVSVDLATKLTPELRRGATYEPLPKHTSATDLIEGFYHGTHLIASGYAGLTVALDKITAQVLAGGKPVYRVEINTPAGMLLHHDTPIEEQPAPVQSVLMRAGIVHEAYLRQITECHKESVRGVTPYGSTLNEKPNGSFFKSMLDRQVLARLSGGKIEERNALLERQGDQSQKPMSPQETARLEELTGFVVDCVNRWPEAAARALSDLGITGLRLREYANEQQRRLIPNRDHVTVFDPASVRVTHRNGVEISDELLRETVKEVLFKESPNLSTEEERNQGTTATTDYLLAPEVENTTDQQLPAL